MNITLFLQIITITILLVVIILVLRQSVAQKKAARITYYSLQEINDSSLSLSDKFENKYHLFIKNMRPYIKKSKYLNKISKRYEKYIKYNDRDKISSVDFVTTKFIISIIFIILTIFSQALVVRKISLFDLILNYFIGYYILDIYLIINYRKQKKLIENEFLRAIIIMNNAFKAGKSTLQALKIASEELPEPINDEFKKMYLDMKYGLSVDTVFDRFCKRVNLKEATYLSSSLTILNKTGGNIVEVFSSIERTLFDKKKLNEELKNISANPNMIIKVLFIIPIIFVGIIYILNPNYFAPLFASTLGYIIVAIIIIMFIIYVLLLKKILKIEV